MPLRKKRKIASGTLPRGRWGGFLREEQQIATKGTAPKKGLRRTSAEKMMFLTHVPGFPRAAPTITRAGDLRRINKELERERARVVRLEREKRDPILEIRPQRYRITDLERAKALYEGKITQDELFRMMRDEISALERRRIESGRTDISRIEHLQSLIRGIRALRAKKGR